MSLPVVNSRMKALNLDFIQRANLSGILSSQEGPLGKIAPLFQILERVNLTEEESKKISVDS